MKTIIIFAAVVGAMSAELPRIRPARFRFQRQEATTETAETTTEFSGYPASGWKPAEPFTLPNEASKPDTYGVPEKTESTTEFSGYPASGWKPAEPFTLPNEASDPQPDTSYGVPEKIAPYPATGWKPSQPFELPQPSTSYGSPESTYGTPEATEVTTDNPQAERLEGPVEFQKSVGTYYVLLPNGQLQKVEFMTENDVQNMKYTARLQYREPLLVFRP